MSNKKQNATPKTAPVQSSTFNPSVNSEIRRAAATGIYDIRGGGAKRKVPHFDDLLFLGASISRYPLEGYREKCDTKVTLGTAVARATRQFARATCRFARMAKQGHAWPWACIDIHDMT